jgi:hypothetical protein
MRGPRARVVLSRQALVSHCQCKVVMRREPV